MKLLTGVLLLSAGVSGAALAQSSVTLYGSIDGGLGYNNNVGGHSQYQMTSGNSQPDRWGFDGTEDLGGGAHAFFRLENGFTVNNGQGTTTGGMFNRQAYVGLSSDRYGSVLLGHTTPFNATWVNPIDTAVLAYDYIAYHPGNIDELSASGASRVDNTIRYVSPTFYGFQAGAQISLSNTTNFGKGRNTSYGLQYNQGPFRAAIAYSAETQRTVTITQLGSGSFQGIATNQTYVADKLDNLSGAVTYKLGNFLLHGLYSHVRLQRLGYKDTFQTFEGGVSYHSTVANLMDVSAFTSTLAGRRWSQLTLSDIYSLSKATQVYADIGLERSSGGAVAMVYSNAASSTSNQIAVRVGIHHSF